MLPLLLAVARLQIPVAPDGSYQVLVDGQEWFTSVPGFLRHGGREHPLELQHATADSAEGAILHFSAAGVRLRAQIQVRSDHAVFTQTFLDGANETQGDPDGIVAAFPALRAAWPGTKGVLAFKGDMTGSGAQAGPWSRERPAKVIGAGISGTGPLVVFGRDLQTSLVLSGFSNFMSHSQTFADGILRYGVMGGVTSVPRGFQLSTVLTLGRGVNEAMNTWGSLLLATYGKQREAYKRDLAIQTLGYSTDNGAFYYYQSEKNKNYQQTMLDVKQYADAAKIPYRYILLDSWWYLQGIEGGVKTWDARPDIFPGGLEAVFKGTQWPQQLHNRYWASDNTYAKQNGGKWDFLCNSKGNRRGRHICVPIDEAFWVELFANKTRSGMFMYEQDWLDVEFDNSHQLLQNATLGRTWMQQMDSAAQQNNVTIQMCMSHVRHILQSVEMPSVTNARASGDYHPGRQQWDIGTSSILAHALGIGPSKDNYWSVPVEKGTHYGPSTREPAAALHSAVSSLSAGPVAPSDAVGVSNVSLILRHCTADGTLLRPDRPATEIDGRFLFLAFGEGGPDGHIWTTEVSLTGRLFTYVLVTNLAAGFPLEGFQHDAVAVESRGGELQRLGPGRPLVLPRCGEEDFRVYLVAELEHGYALLGEAEKWVSVAPQRFSNLDVDNRGLRVDVTGAKGEEVRVRVQTPAGLVTVRCLLGETPAKLEVSADGAACGEPAVFV